MGRFVARLSCCAAFVTITIASTAWAAPPENLQLSTAQWREDLQFIARELPKRHMSAFHFTSRERFEASVADLDRQLPQLDAAHVYVGMMRIVNSIGDGHTYLRFPADSDDFPVTIARFGSEYRVVSAPPQFAKAIGGRLIAINDMPIERVHDLILAVTPQDETPQLREAQVTGWMTTGILLHGLDITPVAGVARLHLIDDRGEKTAIDLQPESTQELRWAYTTRPLFREHPEKTFWHVWLPESRTGYCNWRSYKNLREHARFV